MTQNTDYNRIVEFIVGQNVCFQKKKKWTLFFSPRSPAPGLVFFFFLSFFLNALLALQYKSQLCFVFVCTVCPL